MKFEELLQKVDILPSVSGVYLFYNSENKIIYIGKAKNLKNRVKSYFQQNIQSPKTLAMVRKIDYFETIVTDTEVEAFILEANLIKENKPKYNINLKDDKSYPYIIITNEIFPRIFPTRKVIKNGSKYFGPYTDGKSLRQSFKLIKDLFKIRSCNFNITPDFIERKKTKVCLDYHIKKCDGPCEGLISKENYNFIIKQVEKVLKGKSEILISELNQEMLELSNLLEFEKAEELRQKILSLNLYSDKQKVVANNQLDEDLITIAADFPDVVTSVINIRNGKIVGKKKFVFNCPIEHADDDLYEFIIQSYVDNLTEFPEKILVKGELENKNELEEIIFRKTGVKTSILYPKNDNENQLIKMCYQNSVLDLNELKLQKMKKDGKVNYALKSLQRDLNLKTLPIKIECFDISTLQGSETVASLVVFEDGKTRKSEYKKFIIKSVSGINDFASMREVVERHYSRLVFENRKLPDLIMVDGGKGQLSSAVSVLKKLNLFHIPIIGLAKKLEEVFFPNNKEALIIPRTSTSLKLLQNIRDEAHRFAITFHKQRRDKRTIISELDGIKGIGEKLKLKLLNGLGSVENIKNAKSEEIINLIGNKKAGIIFEYFNQKDKIQ